MKKQLLYVANWKSYLTHNQAIAFCKNNGPELQHLSKHASIVLCPDFTALAHIKPLLGHVCLGAQNCSSFEPGAHTGNVSAASLQEIGVQYCIVGHSERRKNNHETSEDVSKKVMLLLEQGIIPIICVSDNYASELKSIFEKIKNLALHSIVAYEPIQAIGTGKPADTTTITTTLSALKQEFYAHAPNMRISLLYGGSVSPESVQELKTIPHLDGFLIGKASTDFQKLKNIVE